MFQRSTTDSRRVLIVDYNHLVHSYLYGGAPTLSHTVMVNGQPQVIDTTIPTYTIKAIHRWSNKGQFPVAVCFDSPCKCRKGYFAKSGVSTEVLGSGGDYKGGRHGLESSVFESINMTSNLMRGAGISCYKAENYEADDLVYACVKKAKQQYPDLPIDIVCNDADLLPLVDDQVSVFFRSRKYTWAEDKSIEKQHYIQVTPYNYQSVVEGLSSYKNLVVPYNTVLLIKMLRGDKSDNISGHTLAKPKVCKQLVADMENDGINIGDMFRYREMLPVCYDLTTGVQLTEEEVRSREKGTYRVEYIDSPEITEMFDTLSKYLVPELVEHARKVYRGINLNVPFTDLGQGFDRFPARVTKDITGYSAGALQQQVQALNIKLPI